MARANLAYLPRGNPCAQCGKPIASHDWIEQGPGRISYLWTCRACDYRFEAGSLLRRARKRHRNKSRPDGNPATGIALVSLIYPSGGG